MLLVAFSRLRHIFLDILAKHMFLVAFSCRRRLSLGDFEKRTVKYEECAKVPYIYSIYMVFHTIHMVVHTTHMVLPTIYPSKGLQNRAPDRNAKAQCPVGSWGPGPQYPHVAVGQRACLTGLSFPFFFCTSLCTSPHTSLSLHLLF